MNRRSRTRQNVCLQRNEKSYDSSRPVCTVDYHMQRQGSLSRAFGLPQQGFVSSRRASREERGPRGGSLFWPAAASCTNGPVNERRSAAPRVPHTLNGAMREACKPWRRFSPMSMVQLQVQGRGGPFSRSCSASFQASGQRQDPPLHVPSACHWPGVLYTSEGSGV